MRCALTLASCCGNTTIILVGFLSTIFKLLSYRCINAKYVLAPSPFFTFPFLVMYVQYRLEPWMATCRTLYSRMTSIDTALLASAKNCWVNLRATYASFNIDHYRPSDSSCGLEKWCPCLFLLWHHCSRHLAFAATQPLGFRKHPRF